MFVYIMAAFREIEKEAEARVAEELHRSIKKKEEIEKRKFSYRRNPCGPVLKVDRIFTAEYKEWQMDHVSYSWTVSNYSATWH